MTGSSDARLQLIFSAKNLASGEVNKLHHQLLKLRGGLGGIAGAGRSAIGGVVNLGKVAGIAAIGGLAALAGAVFAGISAMKDQAKIDAQTAAVLKSTGGAAHVTAKHVDELANSIKDYSGVDDDAVKSGENMLLTFTEIKNRAGKNNDIFDQATKILTDMSVAMGTDMKTQAIQLGKALNDPVKGVTALTKVGVTFTDQQKKQIAAMVKAGDTAGAQKVILAELTREFGGSAKAVGDSADGAWSKFQNAVSDTAKQLGGYLLPVFTTAVTFLRTQVLPVVSQVIDQVAAWISANQPLIRQVAAFAAGALSTLFHVIGTVVGAISGKGSGGGPSFIDSVITLGSKIFNYVVPKVQAFVETLTRKGGVIDSIAGVVGPILDKLVPALGSVVEGLFGGKGTKGLVPALGDLIGVLWGGGKGPLAIALKAAGGLLTGFFEIMGTVARFVGNVVGGIQAVIDKVLDLMHIVGHAPGHVVEGVVHHSTTGGGGIAHKKARGGPVWPGGIFSVGETGSRESLLFSTGGGVILPDGGAAARNAGGGGVHLHVHSVWPPTPAQVRQMANELDRHEYWAGAGIAASGNRT